MMNKSFSVPIFLLLFFSISSMHALVEPITIDDGIWNVLSRVGIVVDNILGVSGCEYFIHQADIPLTITASGNYCLLQSVTFAGTAVTINSSNVIFDMRNYIMNGNNSSNSVGINILAGTNIGIQHGRIEGARSAGISSSQFLNDVIISNVSFIDVGSSSGASIDFSGGIEGLLVEDCYTSNAGPINIVGSGVTIRNCYMDNFLAGVGSGGIILSDISDAYESRYSIIEDCNLTGSFAVDGSGIVVSLTQNVIVQNCNITGVMGNALLLQGVSNVQCLNCYVQAPSFGPFAINITDAGTETTSVLIDSCFVSGPGASCLILSTDEPVTDISVTNCFFSNSAGFGASINTLSGSGFIEDVVFRNCIFSINALGLFIDAGGGSISTVAVEDCVSQGNSTIGYQIVNTTGTIKDVVFKDCIAQNNGSDGFNATGCFNIIYEHCFSQSNVTNGFEFATTTTVIKVRDCLSQSNGLVGYNNKAPVGANIFLANSSFGDAKAFIGVDLALTKTGTTAVSNATYWNNVVF